MSQGTSHARAGAAVKLREGLLLLHAWGQHESSDPNPPLCLLGGCGASWLLITPGFAVSHNSGRPWALRWITFISPCLAGQKGNF